MILFLSVIFWVAVAAVPPVGVKVTLALTLALPFFFRSFAALPVALTERVFVEELPVVALAPLMFEPLSFSLPGPVTLAASFAVPCLLSTLAFESFRFSPFVNQTGVE